MIEVLNVDLGTVDQLDDHHRYLDEDERKRASLFKFEKHRKQFLIARYLLRTRVSQILEKPISRVRLEYSKYGKPKLSSGEFFFNISHSNEHVILAISDEGEIGVDVEFVQEKKDLRKIASRFFSPGEMEVLETLTEEAFVDAFYVTWTKKEAFIKAHGDGLSIPLQQFEVEIFQDHSSLRRLDFGSSTAAEWKLREVDIQGPYKAAICGQMSLSDVVFKKGLRQLLQ